MFEQITTELVLSVGMPVFLFIIGWVAQRVTGYIKTASDKIGLDIEQTHLVRLEQGIQNVAKKALADGKTDVREIAALALAEMNFAKPTAVEVVQPTQLGVENIVKATIEDLKRVPGQIGNTFQSALQEQLRAGRN